MKPEFDSEKFSFSSPFSSQLGLNVIYFFEFWVIAFADTSSSSRSESTVKSRNAACGYIVSLNEDIGGNFGSLKVDSTACNFHT